jgi:hypothetical protein
LSAQPFPSPESAVHGQPGSCEPETPSKEIFTSKSDPRIAVLGDSRRVESQDHVKLHNSASNHVPQAQGTCPKVVTKPIRTLKSAH